jgi:hypothetical protein
MRLQCDGRTIEHRTCGADVVDGMWNVRMMKTACANNR